MESIFEKLSRYFYHRWHVAVLDMHIGRWVVEPKPSNIAYLKAENANGRHILIQPHSTIAPYYLLIDDITWPLIQQQHHHKDGRWKPGRMLVQTSNNNYQLWIHSRRPLSLNQKRYWLKKLNSDPGAYPKNRWGRCPGFRNRKDKHRNSTGGYPLSKLIWIDWSGRVDIPKISTSQNSYENFSHQPTGGACVNIKKFSAQIMNAQTIPQPILHMQLPFCAEDTAPNLFEIVFCLKEKIGKITAEKKENSIILKGLSNAPKMLSFVVEQNSQTP